MRFCRALRFLTATAACACVLRVESAPKKESVAASPARARVTGVIVAPETQRPVEFAAVTLKKVDGAVVENTVTDGQGRFTLENVSPGDYLVAYGRVGAAVRTTAAFEVDATKTRIDLGQLEPADDLVSLRRFEVTAKQESRLNSIDRKVYNVGKEIQSVAGSASDLLQNVPSVDVDIDGNVSLRGADNVLILINGRSSTLMGRSRAEVLQQLPADSIEKIEVITNPSAKYKPDGTAGIINIALKRKHDAGWSGTASFNIGNSNRYNSSLSLNTHPGPFNVFGSYSIRQDDRPRTASDTRTITDPVTGVVTHADKHTVELSRPLSHIGRLGFDYAPDANNQFGLAGSYNDRSFTRRATDHNVVSDATGVVTSDYDRARFDPESERSREASATYRHTFADEGHQLNLEFKASDTKEVEPDNFTNTYRVPIQPPSFDHVFIHNNEGSNEAIVEYTRPLANGAKLEAGYDFTQETRDTDFLNEALDPISGLWVKDLTKSNRFILDRRIHAFYATYARTFGLLGVLAGVRPEVTATESQLVTTGQDIANNYSRVYPSLHLSYQLTDTKEWQLNYSHRIHRPESEDLNPFPEALDPFTLRAGNPHLQPEDVHSIETGYSYRENNTSLTATAYYRYTYHAFTILTTNLGNGVLLTTQENLSVARSSGLEMTANTDLGRRVSIDFNGNVLERTIDASDLGFSSSRSSLYWQAKLGATVRLGASTQMQLNTRYASARQTPQGERSPSYVTNIGLRQDLWQKKAALVLTVSDLFNSLKEGYHVDTPGLREDIVRRRSARIIYLGITYNFGQPGKKSKDDTLKFDESL